MSIVHTARFNHRKTTISNIRMDNDAFYWCPEFTTLNYNEIKSIFLSVLADSNNKNLK